MPIEKYFKGHGREVMSDMRKRYGERAEKVFYSTANKRGLTGKKSHLKARGLSGRR